MGCSAGALASCHSIESTDAELVAVAREESGLRLRLGHVLEVMQRNGCCFELGFSSLGAYALERCERGARWVEVACCLARRLESLPLLRAALASGQISWSAAELLARVARPESEAQWLERAQRFTVRQLRAELKAGNGADSECGAMGSLQVKLDRDESWLLEATLALLDGLGTRGAENQVEALLAEGQSALLAALPAGAIDAENFEAALETQRRWRAQLACWREEAEAHCEPRIRELAREASMSRVVEGSLSLEGWKSRELDAEVRRLAAEMASHELRLARLLLQFQREDGWRRLGFATETQYARERLGLSRSSLLARRALALRLEKLPQIAEGLGRSAIGVEAALQLARIATPATEIEWLERARGRTVKHLREEVAAALVAVRISGELDCPPPRSEELESFQELERVVLRGAVVEGAVQHSSRRPWREMLTSLGAWLARGTSGAGTSTVQTSARPSTWARGVGRVLVRWRVSLSLCDGWRTLEQWARPWLPRGMSWVRFLCLAFWRAWQHVIGVNVAYGRVYVRDRCRCSSPVCNRRDVTPHHLVFRSAGGGDEDANVASLCTWCHLFGVHGGRIRATGTAARIFWEIGPYLRVDGRERWVK